MKPEGNRFVIKYVAHWDKWVVLDLKYQRDNEVRDWKARGDAGKRKIWRGSEIDAINLAKLLNKAYRDDDKLITNVERSQSTYVPWQNSSKKKTARTSVVIPQFKSCACGAMYKGEKHCD